MKPYQRAITFFCSLFLFIVPTFSQKSERTIRVGISEYARYAYKDIKGNCTGCDVEYAYKIAQYANLNIQIVLIPDAETYFKSLDDGRVDMLFDVLWTKERSQKYLFSEHEAGSTPLSIYVRNDDDRFEYGNISQLRSIVFGSEIDSHVTKIFISWCEKHGFTPQVKEYADSNAVNVALDRKEIDAGVYGTETVEGYRTIMQFEPTPYYIILKKENGDLKKKIDDAMSVIFSEDPLYKQSLVEKYSGSDFELDAFTKLEKEYISQHPQIKVAVIKNDAPYFSIQEGEEKGVFPEYYAEISKLINTKFVFLIYDNQDEAKVAIQNGKADILAMYSDGLISAYTSGLRLTREYTTVNTMLVTRAGTDITSIKTIAVKDRSKEHLENFVKLAPGTEWISYTNAQESFTALKKRKVDAMVCGLPSTTWLINQTNSSAYNSTTLAGVQLDLCGAVDYHNVELCSIMNKAIKATQYKFNGIISRNSLSESSWQTSIARIPPVCLFIFSTILLLAVFMLILTLCTLIHRQKERTALDKAHLENEQREVRLDAQEKSTEIRNQFFSNISHDMRTPLNAIIGFSNLAKEATKEPQAKEYLEKIETSGQLLLNLIDDTLTLSKINSGKLHLNPQPTDSNDLFESLIVPITASSEQKHIQFSINNTSRRRNVIADKLNIQKILLNLLSNAVKYTRVGGSIDFIIKDEITDKFDAAFLFIIKDTGIGISEKFLPHIYEPFIQEQRSADLSSGTGLGLSIVKNLVEMMNGKISVESVIDKGTTFTVRLYLPETKEIPAENGLIGDEEDLSGKKVLLCEDNDLNVEIAEALLKAKGLIVVSAENGREGVQIFRESAVNEFSAILMDLRMPLMNGYEATKAIRNTNRVDAKRIPIIAMTADAFEDDAKKCFEAGMNAHITKPIDPEKVFRALSMLIMDK